MKKMIFALAFLPLVVFGQTERLGLEVVFVFEGDTVDTRYLESFLMAAGYEETKAWATRAVFVEKCKEPGDGAPLAVFDAMFRNRSGRGLKDYVAFYNQKKGQ